MKNHPSTISRISEKIMTMNLGDLLFLIYPSPAVLLIQNQAKTISAAARVHQQEQ
jgi:hypothetical protein